VEVARQREMKWLDMFANWDKWIKQRFQKVRMSYGVVCVRAVIFYDWL